MESQHGNSASPPTPGPSRGFLPRLALIIGLVSLCNDLAGEMLAPVIPLFLVGTLGAGPAVVGLVEGLAQACASILKFIAGIAVDRGVRPKPLMLTGYGLANAMRPLIGLAASWPAVLVLRALDRIGKGLRGTPRDALLADTVPTPRLGRAFGFHRAMDYTGSALGPLIGAIALASGMPMRGLFALAVIPGIAVMALLAFGVGNQPLRSATVMRKRPAPLASFPTRVRALLVAAAVLAVTGVHDAFLVLWLAQGFDAPASVLLVFAGINGMRALIAMFGGELADRLGPVRSIVVGWAGRILTLGALGLTDPTTAPAAATVVLVIALTVALAWSGPGELALIAAAAPDGRRGALLGTYHMVTGLLLLPGTALFGLLWQRFGSDTAFLTAAAGSLIAALALLALARRTELKD